MSKSTRSKHISEILDKAKCPIKKKIQIAYEADPPQNISAEEVKLTSKNVVIKKVSKRSSDIKEETKDDSKRAYKMPANWEQLLDNMRKMRITNPAPVDTMGCERCHDVDVSEELKRFQILISLMLSSQTKDEVNFAACQRLRAFGFTPENLVQASPSKLQELLKPVGFYNQKTKHIQLACRILIDEYNSDIPDTLDGLLKLPGVGKKMAHICMQAAWHKTTGIGVDTHVHRISNRLKFTGDKETKTPEDTRIALEKWVPIDLWGEVNLLMVGFGQTICNPLYPKCKECLSNKICPSAFKTASPKKSKK